MHKKGTVTPVKISAMISIDGGNRYRATTNDGRTQLFGFYSNAVRWLEKQT